MSDFPERGKILRCSHPNGWYIEMRQYNNPDGDKKAFEVFEGNEVFGVEFHTRMEADEFFNTRMLELSKIPNWEKQAQYDEIWGSGVPETPHY
jgi:hypothetical protein